MYGPAAPSAAGIVAGRGDATASSPGTPRTASNGVAIEEPPTPNNPVSAPIATPATTKTGQGATIRTCYDRTQRKLYTSIVPSAAVVGYRA